MKRFLIALVLSLPLAVNAASISKFSSISVAATNYANAVVVTNTLQLPFASNLVGVNSSSNAVAATSAMVTNALGYAPVNKAGDTNIGPLYVDSLTSVGAISAPNIVTLTNLTDTWNNAGADFVAINLNVTDSASASSSSLLRLGKGGSVMFNVTKSAQVTIGAASNAGTLDIKNSTGNTILQLNGAGTHYMGSGQFFGWDSSATLAGTPNTVLGYDSSGVLRVSSGASGFPWSFTNSAAILSRRMVVAKSSNYTNSVFDVSKVITNEGASGMVTNTLPPASSGLSFTFFVQDVDGMTVQAVGDDTIRIAASVSGAAGNISCTTIGNTVTLCAINATEWITLSHEGTWTVSP